MSITTPWPQWRKITKDDPPQFPCWLWNELSECSSFHATQLVSPQAWPLTTYTHWHPDQPTAPEGGPEGRDMVQVGDEWVVRGSDAHRDACEELKQNAPAPAETATPETDAALIDKLRCSEGGDQECTVYPAEEIVDADFARRLERERDQARRALGDVDTTYYTAAQQIQANRAAHSAVDLENADLRQQLSAVTRERDDELAHGKACAKEIAEFRRDRDGLAALLNLWREFLKEVEIAEDRSNLDGDSAEAVLEQLNAGAEEMLALTPEQALAKKEGVDKPKHP